MSSAVDYSLEGVLWVAVGPPNQHVYIRHSIEDVA